MPSQVNREAQSRAADAIRVWWAVSAEAASATSNALAYSSTISGSVPAGNSDTPTSHPVRPWRIASRTPGTSNPTAGMPAAAASRTTRPQPS